MPNAPGPTDSNRDAAAAAGGHPGALLLVLALVALALALVAWHGQPPAPRPASAPASEFSAERARDVLRQLLGDGQPHPVGSAADDAVRQRILAQLAGLGIPAHVEEGFSCHRSGTCATVRNVVARLEGREPGPAVALTAHYDSVPAGPGASDDTASVAAILEIARVLKAGAPTRHPVYLLLDEGEETGLLGAAVFEDSAPEASQVKAVVNLEARGTSGPSYMFETSGADAWQVGSWVPHAVRPVTTSLAAFIYSLLPNDSDLTVFREHHVAGLNFAFIDGATRYHTPSDNFANASPASLQHQGENALAAIRGLAEADLAAPPPGRLVYFDVASLGVVRWPMGWTPLLAILALAGIVVAVVAAARRRTLRGADLALGLLSVPAALVLTALLAWGLMLALVSAGPLFVMWLAHPGPAVAAYWLLALTVVAGLALMLGRRSAVLGLWGGIWLVWAVVGVALAFLAPAISYLFVAPALVAALVACLGTVWRGRAGAVAAAVIVPAVAAALTWFGVLPAIYVGLGVNALPVVASLVAVALTAVAPLVPGGGGLGRRLWLAGLVATAVAVVVACAQPRYTAASQQPLTYVYFLDADHGAANWQLRMMPPLPAAVRAAAPFTPGPPAFPWTQAHALAAPAPALPLAAPDLQVVSNTVTGGKRHLRLRLLSRRGAPSGSLHLPPEARAEEVLVEGHEALRSTNGRQRPGAPGSQDWLHFSDVTLPPGGCQVDLVLGETAPLDVYVSDTSWGLPPAGVALLAARPATAVAHQDGDVTIVAHRVTI